jgi:hypothetical protein
MDDGVGVVVLVALGTAAVLIAIPVVVTAGVIYGLYKLAVWAWEEYQERTVYVTIPETFDENLEADVSADYNGAVAALDYLYEDAVERMRSYRELEQ